MINQQHQTLHQASFGFNPFSRYFMLSLASFEYFSIQGVPFILFAWVGMWVLRPIATLLHELGHGILAWALTNDEVAVRAGKVSGKQFRVSKRFSIEFSFRNGQEGCTRYTEAKSSIFSRFLILLGGPSASLFFMVQSGYLLFSQTLNLWVELPLISWFCCNALGFLRAVIPMRLKATESFPDGPPSDGLQVYKLFFRKN